MCFILCHFLNENLKKCACYTVSEYRYIMMPDHVTSYKISIWLILQGHVTLEELLTWHIWRNLRGRSYWTSKPLFKGFRYFFAKNGKKCLSGERVWALKAHSDLYAVSRQNAIFRPFMYFLSPITGIWGIIHNKINLGRRGGGTFPSFVLNQISGFISSIGRVYIFDM